MKRALDLPRQHHSSSALVPREPSQRKRTESKPASALNL